MTLDVLQAGEEETSPDGAAAAATTQPPVDEAALQVVAARFSQATAELQLLGLLRPARKRRGEHAQKLVWASGFEGGSHVADDGDLE